MSWVPTGRTLDGPSAATLTMAVQRLVSGQWVSVTSQDILCPHEDIRVHMEGAGQGLFADPPRVWIVDDTNNTIFDTRSSKELFRDTVNVITTAPTIPGTYTVHGDASGSIFGGRDSAEQQIVVDEHCTELPTAPPKGTNPFSIFDISKWGDLFNSLGKTTLIIGGVGIAGIIAYSMFTRKNRT